MELILVRHAQANINIAGTVGPCTGLTPLGRQQAEALAARLAAEATAGRTIDAAYTSPRLRTVETATIAVKSLGIPVQITHDLRSPDYGPSATGKQWAEVLANAHRSDDLNQPLLPGAEPWSAHVARVGATLTAIAHAHPTSRVLVVAHAETIKASYTALLGFAADYRLPIKIDIGHTGCTTWSTTTHARRWTLVSHNHLDHLHGRQTA